ncbi:MAG: P-II family nitrogen regulator [bacterium]
MKSIVAYIQPFMLEKVAAALRAKKVHGVTVMACQGFGRSRERNTSHYEDEAVELGYAPKVKIEIVCPDESALAMVQMIRESAHTGRHGDGKIFVTEVTCAVDIRTGEEGEAVL